MSDLNDMWWADKHPGGKGLEPWDQTETNESDKTPFAPCSVHGHNWRRDPDGFRCIRCGYLWYANKPPSPKSLDQAATNEPDDPALTPCDMYGHLWNHDPDGAYRCTHCGEEQWDNLNT